MCLRAALIIITLVTRGSWVMGAFQLGYTAESCDDLRPQRVPFVQDMVGVGGRPAFGPDGSPQFNPNQGGFNNNPSRPSPSGQQTGLGNVNQPPGSSPDGQSIQPILMTTVSPYRIWTGENRYKRGKVIEVRLEGRDFFEAFVMEARALGGGPSNKLPQAGVGRFISAPRTTMFLNCRDRQNSAVVNAPSPVRMNNLTFTWEAPFTDVGDIFFIASVLMGDRYWVFTSQKLLSNPFPGELVGCGIRRTCVRLCGYYHSNPVCSLDEADYVLIIEVDPTLREAQITLGGHIRNPETYIAFGMAASDFSLTDMDMSVCMVDMGRVTLGHYYVKQEILPPYPHAGVLIPDMTDMDSEYIWCRFRRPLLVYGPTSINPTRAMYHYYFKGPKNNSGIYLPESIQMMNISPRPRNITEFYTDVQISNGSDPVGLNQLMMHLILAFALIVAFVHL